MKQFWLMIAMTAPVLATACDPLDTIFKDRYSEYAPTETKVLERPWFKRDNPTKLEPVYCYKTLVELECFDHARPGDERPAVWTYRSARP